MLQRRSKPTDWDELPASAPIVRLAVSLFASSDWSDLRRAALEALCAGFPGTYWAIVETRDNKMADIYSSNHLADHGAQRVARSCLACENPTIGTTWSLHEHAVPVEANPMWTSAQDGDSGLALAAWTTDSHSLPRAAELQVAFHLLVRAWSTAHRFRALQKRCEHDALTGVYSRGTVLDLLEREKRRAYRYGRPLSVLFLDLDDFKQVNDRFGHDVGDRALQHVVRMTHKNLRAGDILGRFGGDEFLIILPGTNRKGARLVKHRIQRALRSHPLTFEDIQITLGVSIGTSSLGDASPIELVEHADRQMYRNKRRRKDRCSRNSPTQSPTPKPARRPHPTRQAVAASR